MDLNPQMAWTVGTALVTAASAWKAVKMGLNGARKDIEDTKIELRDHIRTENEADQRLHEKVGRIEGKLDTLIGIKGHQYGKD